MNSRYVFPGLDRVREDLCQPAVQWSPPTSAHPNPQVSTVRVGVQVMEPASYISPVYARVIPGTHAILHPRTSARPCI